MSAVEVLKLKDEYITKAFDCGNASINSLIHESYFPTILQHASCYVACYKKKAVGFYMLKFRKILLEECPEDIADFRGMFGDCFSVHIEYIAVQKEFQNMGIGKKLLLKINRDVRELCKIWPVRLITLDALKEKYEWYQEIGFRPFNESDMENEDVTIRMFLDCLLDVETVNNYCESI